MSCKIVASLALFAAATLSPAGAHDGEHMPGGELHIIPPEGGEPGVCPLRHTSVEADIKGFVGRVRVTQVFYNPSSQKIEALYVFPLPQQSAVDDMTMTVGDRRVVGLIKPREEARRIYDAARAAGHVTGLLDQERPNIFTQSVANIEPGAEVTIEISYVETLKYESGEFEFVFPMVVGPRYIPGGGSAPAPMTTGKPTPEVPDGDRITPPVTPPGTRAGHDISLTVIIDAGLRIDAIQSELHQVDIKRDGEQRAVISLANLAEIPNKDFILNYTTTTPDIGDAFFVHTDTRGSFFTLMLQPPDRVVSERVVPREIVFVLDTSGSMRGFPIEKAKAVMARAIDAMRSNDTFNLITFAGDTHVLWPAPRPNTPQNRAEAQAFLASRRGGGGTEMMKAIHAALTQGPPPIVRPCTIEELRNLPADGRTVDVEFLPRDFGSDLLIRPQFMLGEKTEGPVTIREWWHAITISSRMRIGVRRVIEGRWVTENGERVLVFDRWRDADEFTTPPMRIVCFMTDGCVGNDMAIIDAVKKNAATTRVFSFGIGNGVNRFLLDGIAHAGRGEVEYVSLKSDAEAAVARFADRISAPVLADIQLDWGSLKVSEVYPQSIPDLFSVKPIMVHGRIDGTPSGTVTLKGRTGAGTFERAIHVSPAEAPHDALASLWARSKVDHLMMQDFAGFQRGNVAPELREAITQLGVDFRLMTQFTSFVAVEEMSVTVGGEPTLVRVPVEMPDGVSYEGIFGQADEWGGNLAKAKTRRFSSRNASQLGAGHNASTPARGMQQVQSVFGGSVAEAVADVDSLEEREIDRKAINRDAPDKIDPRLRSAIESASRDDFDGSDTIDKLKIIDFKIDVRIYLRDTSSETMNALTELGFTLHAESKTVRMVIGAIDVRQLEKLAALDAVLAVAPAIDG